MYRPFEYLQEFIIKKKINLSLNHSGQKTLMKKVKEKILLN